MKKNIIISIIIFLIISTIWNIRFYNNSWEIDNLEDKTCFNDDEAKNIIKNYTHQRYYYKVEEYKGTYKWTRFPFIFTRTNKEIKTINYYSNLKY